MELTLPYVTDRTNKDGTKRYYFRRHGQPLTALPGNPLSAEFMAEYNKCKDWVAPAAKDRAGTFGWACDKYMDSTEFTTKAKATRDARRRVILSMVKEPLDPDAKDVFGDEKIVAFKRAHIEILRDRKAENPNAANERLKILSQIFKLAAKREWVEVNFVRDVERLKTPQGGHETATTEQIAQYLTHHTEGAPRLAMLILKHTGVRVSDLRILGRQHVHGNHLIFETVKTSVLCQLPIDPELRAALPRNNMTFLLTEAGKPFASDKALSQRVSKWFRQAGVEEVTAHSVRKWLATRYAERGASENALMSWFGWKDPKEARPYTQKANRRKMAQDMADKYGGL